MKFSLLLGGVESGDGRLLRRHRWWWEGDAALPHNDQTEDRNVTEISPVHLSCCGWSTRYQVPGGSLPVHTVQGILLYDWSEW
jgi:hypothetical protein